MFIVQLYMIAAIMARFFGVTILYIALIAAVMFILIPVLFNY